MITFLDKFLVNVKISSTWGQSAWPKIYFGSSETKRGAFYSMFTKIPQSTEIFHKWLVGIVDGDGTFYFAKTQKGY